MEDDSKTDELNAHLPYPIFLTPIQRTMYKQLPFSRAFLLYGECFVKLYFPNTNTTNNIHDIGMNIV